MEPTIKTTKPLTALQLRGVKRTLTHIDSRITPHERDSYGKQMVEAIVEDGFANHYWLKVKVDLVTLPDASVLRTLDREYWLVQIGPRGGRVIKMAPKHYEQFNGIYAFGMLWDI